MAARGTQTASKLSVEILEVNGMTEKEDRILRNHVDEVHQNTETLQEMKIYKAMREGIREGKKREKRRIYTTGIGVVAAAAVAFLFAFPSIGTPAKGVAEHSVQTASNVNTENFKAYRSFYRLDPALASALEQNLVMSVGQSTEKNGYRLDVTGAVTDGRKVYILYSVHNNTDKEVIHADFTLEIEGIKESPQHKGASLDMLASESRIQPGQTMDFIYSTNISPTIQDSKNVNFNIILTETSNQALLSSSNKYRTSLDVAFKLYPDWLKNNVTFKTNRTLTIDGQKIKVTQVQYTPLSTYVDLEYDPNNDKQIFQLINPVLISKNGDTSEKSYYPSMITSDNSEVYSDDSKVTIVFKNTENSLPDSLSLKVFGISAVEKDQMKIVVDLNKQKILEAPGSGVEWWIKYMSDNYVDSGSIHLRHEITNTPYVKYSTRLSDTFTDAEGGVHTKSYKPTSSEVVASSFSSKDGTVMEEIQYDFGEKAKDYPQPLTITIEKYLNPTMDMQAVDILGKLEVK